MHDRLSHLYGCTCTNCQTEKQTLNLAFSDQLKPLLNAVEKAFKKLHKKKGYKPEDLEDTKEYKAIIDETYRVLASGIEDNDLSEGLKENLEKDVYRFSQLKIHAQLFEAAGLLTDDKKQIKSFAQFSKDIAAIKKDYNETYLEAEYEFAVGSSLMAEQWENYSDNDRYYLQYRTANDDRVRDSHRALHNITLPKTDAFWDYYFAPNGWRCRCTVVQVLASSNTKSDSKKAMIAGEKATTKLNKDGKNTLDIFRFNPGKKGVVFPPKHPYNKVAGANKVKRKK